MAFLAFLLAPLTVTAQERVPDMNAAFAAAERGEWQAAESLAAPGGALGEDLVDWMRLRAGAGSFGEYKAFLDAREHWPGTDRIQARFEESLAGRMDPEEVIAFFDGREMQTGEGALAHARALEALGRDDEAEALVVEAWLTMTLDESGESALRGAYGDLLAEHHAGRADMLLWRWRVNDALRLLPLLDDDTEALVRARAALIRDNTDAESRYRSVPASVADTPGLIYDRYNWLADRGRRADAVEHLAARSTSAEALGEPFRWSGWRQELARWVMREGDAELAYELAANHFLTEGSAYSDLEWLAGYIALTKLDRPAEALAHFQNLEDATWTPISQGRAWYWIGRAHEALGDDEAAMAAFAEGGQHQTSFYGLLAADRAGLPLDPTLAGTETFPSFEELGLDDNDLVAAGMALLKGGERGLAVLFFAEMGRTLTRDEIGAIGAWLAEEDEPYFEVLLGKAAAGQQIVVPAAYFPVHPMSGMELPVESALAHAIARRESEFRVDAGSSVGALGLMQLMPGTAREVAGWLDLPFDRNRLTRDWEYNATLGSAYLAHLTDRFGKSPVMISAGYNAGPSRPAKWMGERGDPRLGEIDVVDWIEHIPFTETRNYVMRVTESIPVYRARLAGEVEEGQQIGFLDLLNGSIPVVRPQARPDGSLSTAVSVSTADPGAAVERLEGVTDLAPLTSVAPPARPEGLATLEEARAPAITGPATPAVIRPALRPAAAGTNG
ncbi:Putative soluble lytic transglycosylase [Oceanicola granulosus HTCC2516]|uniref:Putative soluble lytic transglycosylase n=2 Tax=Oceanicola granulosus TaxID=252302 RepID=Q2CDL1_OCEGH|nr:Putative soluble lytic transglycosylase [Oceanicola granulosus HTCC2516]